MQNLMKMKNSPFTALLIALEVHLGNLSHRQSFAIILYNKHCRRFDIFYQVNVCHYQVETHHMLEFINCSI